MEYAKPRLAKIHCFKANMNVSNLINSTQKEDVDRRERNCPIGIERQAFLLDTGFIKVEVPLLYSL